MSNIRRNTYGLLNRLGDGGGADDYSGISVSECDFISLDDSGMLGPRKADGGLPEPDFLKPAIGGNLVDAGVDVGISFEGSAPDIGPFEYATADSTISWTGCDTNWNNANNWSDGAIPDATADVVIPKYPAGGFFPIIDNDISAQAKNLVTEG